MAKSKITTEASAEAAYAEAARSVPAKTPAKPVARKVAAKAAPKIVAAKIAAPKPVAAEVAAPKPAVLEVAAPLPALDAVPAVEVVAQPTELVAAVAAPETPVKTPLISLKDITMTTDFTANIADAANEVQAKFQQAVDKSTALVTDMTELAKGNVEAVVESGKLFAAGVQDMGKTYADDAKAAYETATADLQEMASIKSPTELFQLQGKILRRNFDLFVAATSKNTDAALKLANDAIAPISGRVNVTAEKLSQVAA